MALTAAELVAYLRLDKSDYEKGMSDAERSMGKSQGKFKDWASGMGQAAAEVAIGGATAVAGLASAVFATGLNYNTLQQSSRAAMETLMDGAEGANKQMDALDDFATNSPFAKQIFIQAQQQLIGFGMAAEDVIPTLSAVEDSVAAVGGSNEDIASIVQVLAQVEGAGKFTGETLMRLGQRGIDAASIIGDEMGKSGATIREEITSGTLDADDAMKALTTGMTERFGGAAANVKETAVGAADRISAAFRDIGSHMAEPFIDPRGGGYVIQWSNDFADILRAVQGHVPDFVDMMMNRFGPAFDNVSISMKDARDAIKDFDVTDLNDMLGKTAAYAPAIAGVSGALFALGTTNVPIIGRLSQVLGPIPAALGAAALASPAFRDALGDVGSALEPLLPVLGDIAEIAAGAFVAGIEIAADILGVLADIVGPLAEGFSELPDPIQRTVGAVAAFLALGKLMPNFSGPMKTGFTTVKDGAAGVITAFQPWKGRFEGAAGDALSFRTKMDIVADDIGRGFGRRMSGLVSFLGGPWGVAITGATIALGLWAQKQAETKNNVEELSGSLDEQSGAWTRHTEDLIATRLAEEYSRDSLEKLGVGYDDLVEVIKNGDGDFEDLHQRLVDNYMASEDVSEGTAGYSDALQIANTKAREAIDPLHGLQNELEQAKQDTLDKAEATRRANEAMDESERSFQRYVDAIGVMRDDTKSAEERVRAFRNALDELEGNTKTAEERHRELSRQTRDMAGFFRDAAEESDDFAGKMFNMEQGMISHSDEGDRLNDMLDRMATEADAAAQAAIDKAIADGRSADAAKDAAEAQQPYIDSIHEIGEKYNLSEDQVQLMIDTMGLVPEKQAFLMTDEGSTDEMVHKLLNLTNDIHSVPDKEVYVTDEESIRDVRDRLEDMGYDIENIEDGQVEIIPPDTQPTIDAIQDAADGPYTATIGVKLNTSGARKGLLDLTGGLSGQAGNLGVPYAPGKEPRYHGGIDVKGMADGGVTDPSVMDVAQFVKPGDIRFAGDRSDVDEAWIPLDGSRRSVAILEEAMRRMPNYEIPTAEGMAAGGISGGVSGTIEPPKVEEVDAPDTAPLTDTWQEAMGQLNDSTISAFDDLEDSTATSQEAMRAAVAAASGGMVDDTASSQDTMRSVVALTNSAMESDTSSAQDSMRSVVALSNSAMESDTSSAQASMRSTTADAQSRMTADTATQLSNRTSDTASQNAAMRDNTVAQMSAMREGSLAHMDVLRANTEIAMLNMRNAAGYEVAMLRFESGNEFRTMQTEGISAATDLRTGIVSQMSQARTPFTGNVNDLVEVMQRFSSSLNDAYGDMGVKVGSPTSLWTGGILAGYSPGRDIHQFTSPTGGQLNLSGGEGIARPEVVRAMGSARFNQLNAAARRGGVAAVRESLGSLPVQSFADGGIFDAFGDDAKRIRDEFKPQLPDNWVKPVGSTVMDEVVDGLISEIEAFLGGDGWVRPTTGRVTSEYGPRWGGHHAGMDIAAGHGTPVVAPTAGIVRKVGTNIGPGRTGVGYLLEHANKMFTYGGHNPVGGVRVKEGETVMPGQRVGAQGTTGNVTGAHLHWEVHRGSPWADVNPRPFWDAAGAGGGSGGLGSGGTDRWENVIKMALRLNGLPTNGRYVQPWMRQVQTESGGNPRAVQGIRDINSIMGNHARGLLQVIPPTFAAYSRPGMTDIFNPLHNAAAGIAYAKSRYGVTGMLNVIGKGRGYKNGTEYARAGWSMVGEQGPELVRFAGGEQVLNNRETMDSLKPQQLTRREAAMIGEEIARRIPEGGDVIFPNTQVRDDSDIKQIGTTFRREMRKLGRR